MLNKTQKKKAIKLLEEWAFGDFSNLEDVTYGICGNLRLVNWRYEIEIKPHFLTWGEFSGNRTYPVPNPGESPETAYHSQLNVWEHKYGKARMRLCAHIASEMKKEL